MYKHDKTSSVINGSSLIITENSTDHISKRWDEINYKTAFSTLMVLK